MMHTVKLPVDRLAYVPAQPISLDRVAAPE